MMNFGEKIIVCDKCGAEFLVKSVTIKECSVEIGGNTLMLRYFVCPKCDEIYKVLLVEKRRYHELVEDLRSVEMRMPKFQGQKNRQGVRMLDKLQKMAMKKKARLQAYVQGMNKKYTGTFTFVTSENNQKEIQYLP